MAIFTMVTWTVFLMALTKALSTLHASITTNVLLFLAGVIVLYGMSKYFEHRARVEAPVPHVDFKDAPPEYQEYLRYQAMAKKYERSEPVTVQKFLRGFTMGKNWAKAAVIGVMIFVLLVVGTAVYHEVSRFFIKPAPVTSTITNTGGGTVESKNESKSSSKQSNGLNLNFFSSWF